MLSIVSQNGSDRFGHFFTWKNIVLSTIVLLANGVLAVDYFFYNGKFYPSLPAIAGGSTVTALTTIIPDAISSWNIKKKKRSAINQVWQRLLLSSNYRNYISDRLSLEFVSLNEDKSPENIRNILKEALKQAEYVVIERTSLLDKEQTDHNSLTKTVNYISTHYVEKLSELREVRENTTNPKDLKRKIAKIKKEIITCLEKDTHFKKESEHVPPSRVLAYAFVHTRIPELRIPENGKMEDLEVLLQAYINTFSNNIIRISKKQSRVTTTIIEKYKGMTAQEWKDLYKKEKEILRKNR